MQQEQEELKFRLFNRGRMRRRLFGGVVKSSGDISS